MKTEDRCLRQNILEVLHVLDPDLARERGLPLEWFPISSGAKISMDSGTENLDWTALVLRKIIEFTQDGGEINIIVDGINVGAQSYWNAEATMLMHNTGCLIMTPRGCIVGVEGVTRFIPDDWVATAHGEMGARSGDEGTVQLVELRRKPPG